MPLYSTRRTISFGSSIVIVLGTAVVTCYVIT